MACFKLQKLTTLNTSLQDNDDDGMTYNGRIQKQTNKQNIAVVGA